MPSKYPPKKTEPTRWEKNKSWMDIRIKDAILLSKVSGIVIGMIIGIPLALVLIKSVPNIIWGASGFFDRVSIDSFEIESVKFKIVEAEKELKKTDLYSPKRVTEQLTEKQVVQLLERAKRINKILTETSILWVDDHPGENDKPRLFLQSLGVKIYYATTTKEALEVLHQSQINKHDFDLIISDIYRYDVWMVDKFGRPVADKYQVFVETPGAKFHGEELAVGWDFAKIRWNYTAQLKKKNGSDSIKAIFTNQLPLIIYAGADRIEGYIQKDCNCCSPLLKQLPPGTRVNAVASRPECLLHSVFDFLEREGTPYWQLPELPERKKVWYIPMTWF